MRQFVARAVFIPNSTAFRVRTGRTPGRPRQTGQTWLFGAAPNEALHPQKSLDRVNIWACTSSPMTISYFIGRAFFFHRRLPVQTRKPGSKAPAPRNGGP